MIHESSIIEDGAKIADDVTIGPFCNIGKDVELKSGCILESNIILKGKLTLSENVRVFSFTTIGNDTSDIEVGEKTHIREFVQLGAQEREDGTNKKITIGANNFLMGYVQILNGVSTGDFCILTNAVRLYEDVKCEERVIVGGLSTIEAGNTIGTGVMIGGASCVDHDIPPFTLVEGNKATVKGLNVVGLRRRLENKDDIEKIKTIFKQILGDVVDKELASDIAIKHENEYARKFASFISTSNIK
ncbi:acyl-(acyl-carrier-protein)--UDP-N- acetylglucosamine O-acyltransferase [Sulfurimonas gotlandica GD1]|jgi:UDP-N-acetylglucosamine acyltransferase|uniref:Acyl-(Acyl-carrier-protein)--UDP-N-acetylglucosamine O-acyltransferase n=1 Tax=Sulfurimonas gotlandica (strain DSM 19862 / JCM 16533 / GD1) TaxID=929558 RepID=B6BLC2_SULGG|nr:acyl-ACP--UDP-N-acetylglucosamine O-acyltransferase [Sulfurimonas gotlandica]EDZ61960.1 UDP-N-acetylglucosamine acyltransferase [Sulfurimonas gotlandica GD1]EHP28576.1 acyl-(acyl-carrier-protein)--UDP-N- acetylglucosamine O-acyltransferase [Sulfurimonas gotlandica GD1]